MSQIRRFYNGLIIQSTSFQLRDRAGFTPHLGRAGLALSGKMGGPSYREAKGGVFWGCSEISATLTSGTGHEAHPSLLEQR